MTNQIKTLVKGITLLLFPLTQYLFLRLFLRQYLGLRFGFTNTTDYDFLIPGPIAFLVLVFCLESAQPLVIRLNRRTLIGNLAAMGLFLGLNAAHQAVSLVSPWLFASLWFALAFSIALSSVGVLLPAGSYRQNAHRLAMLPCLLLGSSLYFYMNGFRGIWGILGTATANVLHALFNFAQLTHFQSVFTPEEAVRIDHPLLSIRIAKGCGGGDAFFYFSVAFLLIVLMNWSRRRPGRWPLIYSGGVLLMFVLNLVRILGLFGVGIALRAHLGREFGTQIFQALFHLHSGWLLYSLGIVCYLRLTRRALTRSEALPAKDPGVSGLIPQNV